jgi:hypothetical protein
MNIDNGFGAGVLAHRINLLGENNQEAQSLSKSRRIPGNA